MRGQFSALVMAAFVLLEGRGLHAQENSATKIQIDWQEVMDQFRPRRNQTSRMFLGVFH